LGADNRITSYINNANPNAPPTIVSQGVVPQRLSAQYPNTGGSTPSPATVLTREAQA